MQQDERITLNRQLCKKLEMCSSFKLNMYAGTFYGTVNNLHKIIDENITDLDMPVREIIAHSVSGIYPNMFLYENFIKLLVLVFKNNLLMEALPNMGSYKSLQDLKYINEKFIDNFIFQLYELLSIDAEIIKLRKDQLIEDTKQVSWKFGE